MTYRGHIENGAVILDERVALPEGSKIECVLIPVGASNPPAPSDSEGLYNDLLEFAGTFKDTPRDGSRKHDTFDNQ